MTDSWMPLRKARQERGLALRDLERITGISRGTLSRIENGVQLPQNGQLDTIAGALGASRALIRFEIEVSID